MFRVASIVGSRRFGLAAASCLGGGVGYHYVYSNDDNQSALLRPRIEMNSFIGTGGAKESFISVSNNGDTFIDLISESVGADIEQHLSLVFPTMEALLRAGRLSITAAIMAVDYQLYFLTKKHPDSLLSKLYNNEEECDRHKAEYLIHQLHEELEQAQAAYVRGSNNDDDSTNEETINSNAAEQNNETKSHNAKEHMLRIANQLADAEEALDKSGKPRSVHERNATRLLELFRANAGVYIKVGQHLANLDLLLPQEYISRLSSLFDDAPVSSYEDGKFLA
jgi:hypothetical protein